MIIPRISVLTTVYNRKKYLPVCIQSVQNSTFKDWEMIIVDDGSTDGSVEIANKYAAADDRIKVHVNEQNLGDYPNRNRAASLASGEYLKYLDSDDMIYPHGLEIMVKTMDEYPDAALGFSCFAAEDYDPYPFMLLPKEVYRREFLMRGILGVGPTATVIRKKVFDEFGGFSGKRYVGDRELWLELCAKYPLVKMQDGLVFWRRHVGQEIDLGTKNNAYLINNYILKMHFLNSEGCPLSKQEKEMAIKKVNSRHARDLLRLLLKRKKIRQFIRVLRESNFKLSTLFRSIKPGR